MGKVVQYLLISMLVSMKSFSQTGEIIIIKIDTIGFKLNQTGNNLEKSDTPGAVAVLNLEKSEFSVLYRNKVIYYRVEVEQDTTSIPNPKTILNRSIKMKGIDAEGNSGIILIFLGTQSRKFGAYIFNKQQSFYYTGRVIGV